MKSNIKYIGFSSSASVETYVESRLSALARLVRAVAGGSDVDAYVEVMRTTRHHNKGDIFSTEFHIKFPGKVFFAEAHARDMYAAIDEAKQKMKGMLDKHKNRRVKAVRSVSKQSTV